MYAANFGPVPTGQGPSDLPSRFSFPSSGGMKQTFNFRKGSLLKKRVDVKNPD